MSTEPTEPVFTDSLPPISAAEIDTKSLSKRLRLAEHARALPVSPSYFSRTPSFNDRYLALEKLMKSYGNLPVVPPADAERVAWKTLSDLRLSIGEPVKATDYVKCLAVVKRLHQIHPELKPTAIDHALRDFKREVQAFLNTPNPIPIDKLGRALGVGRRKTSTARAFVVEGEGKVLVNGKSLADYFGRVHDRESAVWALHAAGRLDKYNVWARVEGGGTTGQAEALTLAIAKALLAHEPALKPALRRGTWHVVMTGYRMYERFADIALSSRHRHPRPEKSGEEEAWQGEGEKGTCMGQEIVQTGLLGDLFWAFHGRPAPGVLTRRVHSPCEPFSVSTAPPITVQYKASAFPDLRLSCCRVVSFTRDWISGVGESGLNVPAPIAWKVSPNRVKQFAGPRRKLALEFTDRRRNRIEVPLNRSSRRRDGYRCRSASRPRPLRGLFHDSVEHPDCHGG